MSNTKAIPTREEVENLKRNWLADACWDIEDTEGFEAYREELTKFANEQRAIWDERNRERRAKDAERMGVTPASKLYDTLSWYEMRITQLENMVNDLSTELYNLKHKVKNL